MTTVANRAPQEVALGLLDDHVRGSVTSRTACPTAGRALVCARPCPHASRT